jgi:hypothetical protein
VKVWGLGRRRFDSQQKDLDFVVSSTNKMALLPTQTPVWWVVGIPSVRVKTAEVWADNSSPSRSAWNIVSFTPLLYGIVAWCLRQMLVHLSPNIVFKWIFLRKYWIFGGGCSVNSETHPASKYYFDYEVISRWLEIRNIKNPIHVEAVWVVTPCSVAVDTNVSEDLADSTFKVMASQLRTIRLESSPRENLNSR